MNRLTLFLAAFVVGVGLYFDAITPLGLPAWADVAAALAVGVGVARALAATPAFTLAPRDDVEGFNRS